MKVIFMGTPEFAVPTLEKLLHSKNHQVVSVFTQIPKAKGRGLETTTSPIHKLAIQYNIPAYTPTTLKTIDAKHLIDSIDADIIVVVAYGFLIPPTILYSKKYGCLNIHPSSLPRHRGAAPMQWTIIEGDHDTSVCVMQMDEGLDTGDIILQKTFALSPRILLPQLHNKCALLGAELLIEALDKIDTLPRVIQSKTSITYASKLKKEDGKINWHESSYKIDCKIRGMNPWPGTYFEYKNKKIKVLEADYNNFNHQLPPGTVMNDKLEVACGQGVLVIKQLQIEGKKPMPAVELLRGFPIPAGVKL